MKEEEGAATPGRPDPKSELCKVAFCWKESWSELGIVAHVTFEIYSCYLNDPSLLALFIRELVCSYGTPLPDSKDPAWHYRRQSLLLNQASCYPRLLYAESSWYESSFECSSLSCVGKAVGHSGSLCRWHHSSDCLPVAV